MRSGFVRLALAVAVCGLVAAPAVARATGSTASPRDGSLTLPPVIVMATPARASKAEPHPEIWDAIHSLEKAKAHLAAAAHDFGGHRVEAIAAIDAALHQLHVCLDFDK
jgi:hypothetical protein